MKFLLDGAIRLSPGPSLNYREFVKHGGIRQAVADFHALRPNDIQEAMQPVMVRRCCCCCCICVLRPFDTFQVISGAVS